MSKNHSMILCTEKISYFLSRDPKILWLVIQLCKQKSFIIYRYIQTLFLIDPVPAKCNGHFSAEYNGTWIKFLGIDAHLIRQHKKYFGLQPQLPK